MSFFNVFNESLKQQIIVTVQENEMFFDENEQNL